MCPSRSRLPRRALHVNPKQLAKHSRTAVFDGSCFGAADIRILGWRRSRADSMADKWLSPAPSATKKNPIATTQDSIAAGQKIYSKTCVMCHGKSGDADGPAVIELNIHPARLSNPQLLGHRIRRVTLLEDYNRQKADAGIRQTTFRNRPVEPRQLHSNDSDALKRYAQRSKFLDQPADSIEHNWPNACLVIITQDQIRDAANWGRTLTCPLPKGCCPGKGVRSPSTRGSLTR